VQPGLGAGPLRGVSIVVRAELPETAGNRASAQRLAAGLSRRGVRAQILEADALASRPAPGDGEVVHALHARHAGLAALRWTAGGSPTQPSAPVVWTFTGTDLAPEDLQQLGCGAARTTALVCYHPEAAALLARALPGAADRIRVIAPGVEIPAPHAVGAATAAAGQVTFLLPAGLRPVKNPELALDAVAHVRAAGIDATLLVAGPARDPACRAAFFRRLQAEGPHALYLGEVPHAAMGELYRQADIVLNTSDAEGLSNAVLEAMAAGRPVLATDIAGNRAAVRHGVDGWLASAAGLPAAACLLARDPGLRRRLGEAARAAVALRFGVGAEIDAHLRLYAACLSPAAMPATRRP